jgi:N-acetylneuraminic acid mutarotase
MLVFGAFHSLAYNPQTNAWRQLRKSVNLGIVVWTGREAIGWGGGCCGDAQANGVAYDPTGDTYRPLPRSPLAPSQEPAGAWTGRELVLFVSGYGPDGKPYPPGFVRAAAYNPVTNRWRRLARFPMSGPAALGPAVWDGHELLLVAAGKDARSAYSYNPGTNHWRRLASLPSGRAGASVAWTGRQLLLWGGQTSSGSRGLNDGLAYDPHTDRWSSVPRAPLAQRDGSAVAWTGRALIVWGGEIGTPGGTSIPPKFPRDGAAFTPATQ